MTFAWPWMLVLAVVPVLLAGIYVWLLRRRRRFTVVYSDLSLIRAAMPRRSTWRQHIPAVLVGLALLSMIAAVARPLQNIKVPFSQTSIILAIDVSRSMCATDIAPNRLAVAQDAAKKFVESQAGASRIGVVAFSGSASIVVPPTADTDTLVQAIDGFTTSFGTAMGSATFKSLDALAEINPDVVAAGPDLSPNRATLRSLDKVPDIIVLLTDGANSQGVNPVRAAQQAADRRVRVYTIGFGTDNPTELVCNAAQVGADFIVDPFGGGTVGGLDPAGDFGQARSSAYGDGVRQLLVIDEPTLEAIAEITEGEYFRAEDADQLVDVFLNLPSRVELIDETREVSVVPAALAALLVLAAVVVSLRLNRVG